jgi:DUF4097 and DUF4098 domain-containing protein YvlB
MRAKSLLLTVAIFALAVSLQMFASPWQGETNGDTTHWSGAMTAGQTLVVKNISGDIRVEPATGNVADITAVKSGADSDEVHVSINKTEEGVTACTIYPGNGNTCDHSNSRGNIHARVDYTIHIPRGIRLRAANVNGSVEAENLSANAEVSSVNGSVSVSTTGWAEAESVNGSVHATLGNADWPDELRFKSVNGNVDVTVPSGLNADIRFSTLNGHVTSDFPYTVEGGTSVGGHGTNVEGRIGSGGRRIELSSVNGNLELRKQ